MFLMKNIAESVLSISSFFPIVHAYIVNTAEWMQRKHGLISLGFPLREFFLLWFRSALRNNYKYISDCPGKSAYDFWKLSAKISTSFKLLLHVSQAKYEQHSFVDEKIRATLSVWKLIINVAFHTFCLWRMGSGALNVAISKFEKMLIKMKFIYRTIIKKLT